MIRRGVLAWFVLLGACAAPGADIGSSEEAIVDGTLETGRPAVVFMYRQDGAACTGSIIAPRVVLTANHCVESGGSPAPASYFRIYVGSSTRSLTAEYRVSEVRPVENAGLGGRQANDVALLILSSAARETPLEIARTNPTGLWGADATAVGYGQTPSGSSGTKYWTTARVEGVQEGFIFVDPSVCQGDSGGPLIGADGLVYGVASFIYSPDGTSEPRCGTAPGAYNEIYRHLAFIESVLEETGTCIADPETCNGADDNCDGVVDEGCIALGQPCTDSGECVGGLCADTPVGRICTSTCDPLRPGVGCGAGFYCGMSGGCTGHCLPGEHGELAHGEECASDTECVSLFCIDPGDGRRRCLDPCRGDAGLCLAGEVCAAGAGACGGCVERELVRARRGLGEPCDGDDECNSGVCHEYGGISECAAPCSAEGTCAEGFECREELCIRDRRQGVGGVCLGNADCGDAICAAQADRHWCTSVCGSAEDCPSGFDCVAAGGTMVCAPVAALDGEDCEVDTDCASGLCAFSGGAGVCTSLCDARNACAPGFECRRTGDGTTAVCIHVEPEPVRTGSCSVGAPGRGAGAMLLALLAMGLVVLRRRR